jgi:hypothetical protein
MAGFRGVGIHIVAIAAIGSRMQQHSVIAGAQGMAEKPAWCKQLPRPEYAKAQREGFEGRCAGGDCARRDLRFVARRVRSRGVPDAEPAGVGKVIYQVGNISFLMRPPADAR